jgi:uncharacterized protein (TIGR02266 family)
MSQDTRKDPRAQSGNLVVRYKSATVDEFIENHSHDVSRGGLFVKTNAPQPPGTLLKFEIRLASDQAVIAGVGRVVWKRDGTAALSPEKPAGMGVKFIKIDDASRKVIEALVAQNANAGAEYLSESHQVVASKSTSTPPGPTAGRDAALQTRATPLSISAAATSAPPPAVEPKRVTFAARKATVIGMPGASEPPQQTASMPPVANVAELPVERVPSFDSVTKAIAAPNSATGATLTELSAARPTNPNAGGGISFAVPSRVSEEDPRARPEPTMMRQAADVLADALHGAGGSFDEIGHDPIFDQPLASGGNSIFDEPPQRPAAGVPVSAAPAFVVKNLPGQETPKFVETTPMGVIHDLAETAKPAAVTTNADRLAKTGGVGVKIPDSPRVSAQASDLVAASIPPAVAAKKSNAGVVVAVLAVLGLGAAGGGYAWKTGLLNFNTVAPAGTGAAMPTASASAVPVVATETPSAVLDASAGIVAVPSTLPTAIVDAASAVSANASAIPTVTATAVPKTGLMAPWPKAVVTTAPPPPSAAPIAVTVEKPLPATTAAPAPAPTAAPVPAQPAPAQQPVNHDMDLK